MISRFSRLLEVAHMMTAIVTLLVTSSSVFFQYIEFILVRATVLIVSGANCRRKFQSFSFLAVKSQYL